MTNRDTQAPDKAAEREDRALDALRELDGICEHDLWGYREGHPTYDKVQKVFALAPKPTGTEAGRGVETDALVDRFAVTLKAKMRASEEKYGWQNGWLKPDWSADCQRDLARHVAKGDPLDVAAYAAFCWHHGWSTATPTPPVSPTPDSTGPAGAYEALKRVSMIQARELKRLDPHGSTPVDLDEAMVALAAALTPSAPIAAPVRDDGAREALEYARQLLDACMAEFGLDDHEDADEEAVGGGADGDMEITFGHMRRLRNALASLPTPVSDVPGEAQTQEGGR